MLRNTTTVLLLLLAATACQAIRLRHARRAQRDYTDMSFYWEQSTGQYITGGGSQATTEEGTIATNGEVSQTTPSYNDQTTTTTEDYRRTTTGGGGGANGTAGYCVCDSSTMWIDVVFVVDSTQAMTLRGTEDVNAVIQSVLYDVSLGDGRLQSQFGVVVYGDGAQTAYDLTSLRSNTDVDNMVVPYLGTETANGGNLAAGLNQAITLLHGSSRSYARQAIVIVASSFDSSTENDPTKVAQEFKDDGGVIITYEYMQSGSENNNLGPAFLNLASPGYNFSTTQEDQMDGKAVMQAFCDVNCFCPTGLKVYTPDNNIRNTPSGGCYEPVVAKAVYRAAAANCVRKKGFVATVHNAAKQFYLMTLFQSMTPYWIGLQYEDGRFLWADNTTDLSFNNWAAGEPSVGVGECVYSQQSSGFQSDWHSADCKTLTKAYFEYPCESRPCDSTYHCDDA